MERTPKMSILLPVYQGERYLEECLDSILRQTFKDFEVVIRDDGSTDNSKAIIARYAALDSRIRCLTGGVTGKGLFHNLDAIAKSAMGDYLHILCQDDRLEPHCLQTEVAFFQSHPTIGMAYSIPTIMDKESKEIAKLKTHDLPDLLRSLLALQQFYFHGSLPGNLSTVVMRNKCYKAVGGFNTEYKVSGDYEMWVRLCEKWDLGIMNAHLVVLRRHLGQLSQSSKSLVPFLKENKIIRKRILKLLPKEKAWSRWWYGQRIHRFPEVMMLKEALKRGEYRVALQIFLSIGPIVLFTAPILYLLSTRVYALRPHPGFILSDVEKNEIEAHYLKYGRN